jgi:outer membrane protein assembly factor BamB
LVTPGFPGTAYVVLIGDYLYGYSSPWQNPPMICLDPNTGDVKWKKDKLGGPFIAAGNKLMFIQSAAGKSITGSGDLVVAEASPDGYKEIGRTPALTGQCWTAPSLAHGLVYCRNTKGDVVCLDLSGK